MAVENNDRFRKCRQGYCRVYVQCPNKQFLSQEFNNMYTILFFVSDCICLGNIYCSNQLSQTTMTTTSQRTRVQKKN